MDKETNNKILKNWSENLQTQLSERMRYVILPEVIKILSGRIGEQAKISGVEMVKQMRAQGVKISGTTDIRKAIHIIRTGNMIQGVVGSGNGYYIAKDYKDLKRYLDSNLRPRFKSVAMVYFSMMMQLDDMTPEEERPEPGNDLMTLDDMDF